MNCNEFEEICINGNGNFGTEAQAHLESCEQCRRFAAVVACIGASAKSPRDFQTETACKALVAANERKMRFAWRGLIGRVACVAAALLLMGIVWQMAVPESSVEPQPGQNLALSPDNDEWSISDMMQGEILLAATDEFSYRVSDLELRVSMLNSGL